MDDFGEVVSYKDLGEDAPRYLNQTLSAGIEAKNLLSSLYEIGRVPSEADLLNMSLITGIDLLNLKIAHKSFDVPLANNDNNRVREVFTRNLGILTGDIENGMNEQVIRGIMANIGFGKEAVILLKTRQKVQKQRVSQGKAQFVATGSSG